MNDLDHPSDYSDHPLSVDQKFVATLLEIDALTEGYIRQEIGDSSYDLYKSEAAVESSFETIVRDASSSLAQLATQRRGQGSVSELERVRRGFLEVNDEIQSVISNAIQEDLRPSYPGMEVVNAQGGLLTCEQKYVDGTTLRVTISAQDGRLDVAAHRVRYTGEEPEITPVDLEATQGEADGIDIDRFKSDVLMSLQYATNQLKLLKDLST